MTISLEKKKAEAIARMEMLQIDTAAIQAFEAEQKIACFEGVLGTATKLDEENAEQIRLLEADRDILVYAIIFGNYSIGSVASCLYVGEYPEEWEDDRRNIGALKTQGVAAYVFNCTDPDLSEFGYIGIAHTANGGLRRVW